MTEAKKPLDYVKRGISTIISKGGSDADIREWVAANGYSEADFSGTQQSQGPRIPVEESPQWWEKTPEGRQEMRRRAGGDPGQEAVDVLGGLNRGLARTFGAPVDLMAGLLNAGITGANMLGADVPTIQNPIGGSASIEQGMQAVGVPDPGREPQSTGGRIAKRVLEETSSVLPILGGARVVQKLNDVGRLAMSPTSKAVTDVLASAPKGQITTAAAAGLGAGAGRELFGEYGDLPGLVLGALTGAGIVEAGRGAGAVFKAVRNASGARDPKKVANEILKRGMTRDNISPEMIAMRVAEGNNAGVPMAPVDVAGRNMSRLGRVVETTPGRGSDAATLFLESRQAGQGARVVDQISKSLADPQAFKETSDALIAYRSAASKEPWEKAMNAGMVWNDKLDRMLQEPIAKAGMRKGIEIQRIEAAARGEVSDPSTYGITRFNEAGDPVIEGVPNMRVLQATKEGIDRILESAEMRDPKTGRLNKMGRAVDQYRRALVDELKALNPAYARALQVWAGPSAARDAMMAGRRFALGDMEETVAAFKKLTPAEQEFYRLGVARELRSAIEKPSGNIDVVKRIWGSPDAQKRMRALFSSDAAFQQFSKAMELERLTTKTDRAVRGNSQSMRIATDLLDVGDQSRVADAVQALNSNPGAMLARFLQAGKQRAMGVNEDVSEQLGNYLFNTDAKAAAEFAKRLGPMPLAPTPSGLGLPPYERNLLIANMLRSLPPSERERP